MIITKKILAMALLGMVISTSLMAQSARSGIKGGVNFSNLFIDEVEDENMRTGFHLGVYTQLMAPSGMVGFQPELLYSTKGARGTYNILGLEGEQKFNLSYIDLPLLLVIKLGESVDINVGGYASYLVSSSVSTNGDLGDYEGELDRDNFKPLDYGLVGGLAINLDALTFGVRYNYGLEPIAKGDVAKELLGNSKNGVGQIYAAFNLSGGK